MSASHAAKKSVGIDHGIAKIASWAKIEVASTHSHLNSLRAEAGIINKGKGGTRQNSRYYGSA